MRLPAPVYHAACPECGRDSPVRFTDSADFWVAGLWWICPCCGTESLREQLVDGKQKQKES